MSSQPGPIPQLDPPDPINPAPLPTTGITELDTAISILMRQFAAQLDGAVDEVYGALSHAYPGLYADPDAPTTTTVEYRVTETTGHVRWLPAPAAVHAHRMGHKVERRVVTVTEWEVEPNPNTRYRMPVADHPQMQSDAERDAAQAAVVQSLPPAGYPVGRTPIPADEAAETQPLDTEQMAKVS